MYLGEDHPLHIRRTLDQYYYANSSNLKGRDEDQTSLRYFRDQDISSEEFDPVLTMVDQLWMWVLPKCGESPPTIITAFPERSNRNVQKPTALMANIVGKCRDLSNWSCYEVAEIIVTECSRIYLDSTSNRNQIVQFLHVYESSIGRIMDSDAERFRTFPENMRKANEVLGLAKRKAPRIQTKFRHLGTSKTEQDRGSKANEALDGEDLQELLDIEDDIEDLRQIKDIRDELLMMNYLFYTQHEVIREMKRIVQGDRSRIESKRASKKFNRLFTSPYPPHAIVEQNLNEVGRLDELAQKAEKSIQYLLELKQKQADLVLTKAIYNINDATDRQGKTLLTFTVVTIIFLPLSFMASFLALDIVQFPWEGDKLPLNWVVKIILSVSLPLSVALLFIAFNLNESQRKKHLRPITKLMSPLMRLAAREQSEPRPSGMRKRNYNPDRDAEEGTNGAFAP
ncbi:hypothetical protein F4679DRAFT_276641 [Xylaria curta]|nr:hypothetical protein F4679DRAFT_276641 [Xylaria curta]